MNVDFDQIGPYSTIYLVYNLSCCNGLLDEKKIWSQYTVLVVLPFWDLTCFNMSFLAGKGENWKKVADLSDDICD